MSDLTKRGFIESLDYIADATPDELQAIKAKLDVREAQLAYKEQTLAKDISRVSKLLEYQPDDATVTINVGLLKRINEAAWKYDDLD